MRGLDPRIHLLANRVDCLVKPGNDVGKRSLLRVVVMSEDFLKNPLSLFDIRGKTAIVTGATGAFGALAAKVLAGAGANVVLCANNAGELKKVAAACKQPGGEPDALAERPR